MYGMDVDRGTCLQANHHVRVFMRGILVSVCVCVFTHLVYNSGQDDVVSSK